jgi:5-methylcytosine-specific restriction endonuclease McrA
MPNGTAEWARRRLKSKRSENAKAAEHPEIVKQIQAEAKKAGATLAHGGQGGLDPNLALKVFQRDKWRCTVPQCKTPQKNLDLDHIGGHPKEIAEDPKASPELKKAAHLGHEDTLDDLHVICEPHHNAVHSRERDIEKGKKPKPIGPVGIKDDR